MAASKSCPSSAKKPRLERRRFVPSWKTEFPWVIFDRGDEGMRCRYCIDAGKNNAFTKGCDKFKKDALSKHALTVDHRAAIEAKAGRREMQKALANVYKDQEISVIAALKTVYFMAKKNLPNDHFSDLKHFLVLQGCKEIGGLSFQCGRAGRQFTYEHSDSVRGFQEAIATVVNKELDEKLSLTQSYSLLIDESTDIATDHNLVMYMRYVLNGDVYTRFLSLIELPGGTADEILDTVLKVFTARNISVKKLCGVATDGASVMVGCRTGVTTQLKGKNPFIVSIHCIAHRLALASGQAADSVPYIKQYQLYVNNIYKYFHYSTKNTARLKEIQTILQVAERKFHQVSHTCWLSFEGAIDAIVASLDPLYSVLVEESSSGDPTASGILNFMVNFKFLATTYLLSDVLPVLARLSKRFQRSQVDFTTVTDGVSVTTSTLATFKSTPGPKLAKFLSEIPATPSSTQSFYYLGHKITDSQKQRDDFGHNKRKLIDQLIENLKSRFPDSGVISSFSIFDPQNLPPSADLISYGDNEIKTLAEYYGVSKQADDGAELEPLLDGDELKAEWIELKQIMSRNFKDSSIQGMAKKLLTSIEMQEQFPNTLQLLTIALTIPVSSVDCERGFSKQNLIKTKIRARLKTETVSTLMTMSVDTPELEQFDFHNAFEIWCSVKDRVICRSIDS